MKKSPDANSIWPSFFLVGAPKAGTTAVFEALARHPDVFCPIIKEPNYFNTDIAVLDAPTLAEIRRNLPSNGRAHFGQIREEREYLGLYKLAGGYRAIGDFSVNYMRSRKAASNIREKVPDARLIAILRNPIDRAFSHYMMDTRIGRVSISLTEELNRQISHLGCPARPGENYIETGLYAPQLRRLHEAFRRDQVLVVLFDDLVADFPRVIRKICAHIGVDPNTGSTALITENAGKTARFGHLNALLYRSGLKRLIGKTPNRIKAIAKKIYYTNDISISFPQSDKDRLREIFKEDVHEIEAVIERDLSHWLR